MWGSHCIRNKQCKFTQQTADIICTAVWYGISYEAAARHYQDNYRPNLLFHNQNVTR